MPVYTFTHWKSTFRFKWYRLFLWEKVMAPHFCTLAWKILWMEESGRLQSMGSLRIRHDWATSLSLFTFMHWRRRWPPTPVFLPGESQGRRSLVGCRLWGCTVRHDWSNLAAAAAAAAACFFPYSHFWDRMSQHLMSIYYVEGAM